MRAVVVEVRGILLAAERDVAHLGVADVEQRFDRDLEDLHDFASWMTYVERLVDDADERRDEEAAVRDDVVEAADQLDVSRRDADFFLGLADGGVLERLSRLDRAAGKGDLAAVRGEVLRALGEEDRPAARRCGSAG